jgi:hypothetical protein
MNTARTTSGSLAFAALLGSFALPVLVLAFASTARGSFSNAGCSGAYGWPLKPFAETHPVRGNLGDLRTRYEGPRTDETLETGEGSLSFHQGLDINAPDGTPVYAVSSGTVTRARGRRATVTCGNGRSFQYWHIQEAVRVGQRVEAGKTVIGFILPKREHVHLTELRNGQAVNPLAPGHLTPYHDTTRPQVVRISIHDAADRLEETAEDVSGHVFFVAEATDTPAVPVRGKWHGGYPVTPALVTGRIEHDGRTVVATRIAWDVRRSVPKNDRFWQKFARGTYQNWPVFGSEKYRHERGRYLFRLGARGIDTRVLRRGEYELVVTATDTAGNRDERRLRFTVQHGADV